MALKYLHEAVIPSSVAALLQGLRSILRGQAQPKGYHDEGLRRDGHFVYILARDPAPAAVLSALICVRQDLAFAKMTALGCVKLRDAEHLQCMHMSTMHAAGCSNACHSVPCC